MQNEGSDRAQKPRAPARGRTKEASRISTRDSARRDRRGLAGWCAMSTLATDATLRELLASGPRIALVGASSRPGRPSHDVMQALLGQGYDIVPVNPNEREVLGRTC